MWLSLRRESGLFQGYIMNSRVMSALAVSGLSLCASGAQGAITLNNGDFRPLAEVLGPNNPDRGVIIGDKLFTFLNFTSVDFSTSNVLLTAFIANNPLTGIGFDLTGGFGDQPGDTHINEFNLRYTVEILPAFYAQGYRIVDTGLSFNGSASGTGSYARVDESIFDFFGVPGLNLLGTRSTFANAGPPPTSQLQDFQFLPGTAGYQKLEVNKDVQFYAPTPGGTSSASFVRQSFSQIPSPGGAALLGLAGLVAARRRRS